MANDPPTSMKMRFGGLDAKDIGVTNFRQPRAASSTNLDVSEEKALRRIAALSKAQPDLKERFAKIVKETSRFKNPYQNALRDMYKVVRNKRAIERRKKGLLNSN
jgi:hypothetical protein